MTVNVSIMSEMTSDGYDDTAIIRSPRHRSSVHRDTDHPFTVHQSQYTVHQSQYTVHQSQYTVSDYPSPTTRIRLSESDYPYPSPCH